MTEPDWTNETSPPSGSRGIQSAGVRDWEATTRSLRRLARAMVGDDARAEDVVQGALCSAIERRPLVPGAGWLRAVVRSRSVDVLRARRRVEESLDGRDVLDERADPARISAHFELQRRLLEAVEALPEDTRRVIYLRYFEGEGPATIAARLGLPVKTVKSRLSRGLERLRTRLAPERDGGRWSAAWLAFVRPAVVGRDAPFSGASLSGPSTGLLSSTLLLATMKPLLLSLLALLVLFAAWFTLREPGDPAEPGAGAVSAAPDDPSSASSPEAGPEESALTAPEAEAGRDSVQRTAGASTGRPVDVLDDRVELRVRVLWEDRMPAPGVSVICRAPYDDPRAAVTGNFLRATDAEGLAVFPRLPLGRVALWSDRGDGDEELSFELERDHEGEVEFLLRRGVDVQGRVVDREGRALADAGVYLTSRGSRWTAGRVVTRTDAAGRFSIRDVPGTQSLGALAAGHLPSELVDLDTLDKSVQPVEFELVVDPGGAALTGVVVDPEGEPVADALVAIGGDRGYRNYRNDETMIETWGPPFTRTDAAGRFSLQALEPGTREVWVQAVDWPHWTDEVELSAGATRELTVNLTNGARVHGVARDADGEPLAGARIHVFDAPLDEDFLQGGQVDFEGPITHLATESDEDGSYELWPVPAGEVFLYAQEARTDFRSLSELVLYARTSLTLAEGGEATWDPVISAGRTISGRVTYASGDPITMIFVNLRREGSEDRRATYSEDGSFQFVQLEDADYTVRAQIWSLPEGASEPVATGVRPDSEPLELVADFDPPAPFDPATVIVRVDDAAGRIAAGGKLGVQLESLQNYSWRIGTEREGTWTFSVDEAGSYRPVVSKGDRVVAFGADFEVEPGGHHDLGTLETIEGGTLVLELRRDDRTQGVDLTGYLRSDAVRTSERLSIGMAERYELEGILPGPGVLRLRGSDFLWKTLSFDVVEGETQTLEVELEAAVRVPFKVQWDLTDPPVTLGLEIYRLGDDEPVHDERFSSMSRRPMPMEWGIWLPPGTYRGVWTRKGETLQEFSVEVPSFDPDEAPLVELDLR